MSNELFSYLVMLINTKAWSVDKLLALLCNINNWLNPLIDQTYQINPY